jgi:hypothetical protein
MQKTRRKRLNNLTESVDLEDHVFGNQKGKEKKKNASSSAAAAR